jgi:GntR family transcriptional regulator
MRFSINTSDQRPIYVQIMDEVRRALVLGILEPEEALPSVRQLASELGLNPNTVAQAYRELEREGVVYMRRGHGTFVCAVPEPGQGREVLARGVAERALIDAHRHGIGADELIEAIRRSAAAQMTDAGEAS